MTPSTPQDALTYAHMRLRQIKEALSHGDHACAARLVCETVDAPILTDALGLEREPSVEEPSCYTPEAHSWTREQLWLRAQQLNAAAADSIGAKADSLRRDSSMLLQAVAQQERWEQLKAELNDYANQRGDDSVSTYRLGAKSMASTAVDIMTRLERP